MKIKWNVNSGKYAKPQAHNRRIWRGKFFRIFSVVHSGTKGTNVSVSPFDICNSSMINGHFTYRVKNVVFQPQQVKPHVCAFDHITHNPFKPNGSQPNNQTTYQFIVLCQIRQRPKI